MITARKVVGALARFPLDVARAYRGRPSSSSTYLLLRRAHVLTTGRSTALLTTAFRHAPGFADRLQAAEIGPDLDAVRSASDALTADGITSIANVLSSDEVAELVDFATHGPATLTHSDGSRSTGTYHDRRSDVVAVKLDQSFVLTQPAVQAMLARATAARIGQTHFEMWPTVHPPILFWSCRADSNIATSLEERLARRYHSDFDGLGGLRLHVYLTDVDDGAAPMDYVRTSHRPGAIGRKFRKDVTDDIPESTVRELFSADCLQRFTGPAGTSFMSDPNGLHRGNTPRTSDRLVLVMPMQAGSLAGAYNRIRRVPVVDEQFGSALQSQRRDLRMFEAATSPTSKFAVFTN